MGFYADLHIHSKHSYAASKDCDLERLSLWGRKKGLTVVATGDFTHPAWFAELQEKLAPAEPGLFRLREDLDKAVRAMLPLSCRDKPNPFHAVCGGLHHLPKRGQDAQDPPPGLCPHPAPSAMDWQEAGPHRQHRSGWPPHFRIGFPPFAGDHPGGWRGLLPGAGPYLDPLVRRVRRQIRV